MNDKTLSRRIVLKQLATMSVLGALGPLRSLPLTAAEVDGSLTRSIPEIKGKIIHRQDDNYELWRQSMVWHQSKPDRYPDVIIQAQSEQDVIAAVKHAAENKLKVAIRSGGHNSNGPSLRDGGLLIDVSALSDVQIDKSKQIAYIQPGVRSLQLVTETRAKGLSFPVPHCPSVGLSGFVMGGGIGWNYPQRGGVATFSIMGAEIVTANGKRVLATADQNPDLFWAVRGVGPGFFGVVTRLHLKLYPVPKSIMASSYIFPLADLEIVTTTIDDIRKNNNVERVELITLLMHHPEVPPNAPPEESKICFVTAFAFEDSEDEAKIALEPFAQSALATKSMVKIEHQAFSFEELYDRYFSLEDSAGRMARYAVDNVLTNDGGKTLHALADHFRRAPAKDCHVLAAYGLKLESRDDACFSTVADCFVGCYAIWDGEENDDTNFRWLDQTLPLMDPFAEGHYVNEVEGRGHPDRFRQCFSEANWKRLQQLRQKYDPNGVFHSYLGHS